MNRLLDGTKAANGPSAVDDIALIVVSGSAATSATSPDAPAPLERS